VESIDVIGVMPTPPLTSTTGVDAERSSVKSPIGALTCTTVPSSTPSCRRFDTWPAGTSSRAASRFTEMRSQRPCGASERLY
jgi:hypothetical protein